MRKKSYSILLFMVVTSLVMTGCDRSPQKNTNDDQKSMPSVIDKTAATYETKYLKISVLDGWTVKEATKVRYEGTKKIVEPNPAAVNIVKGKYILYINAQAQQASGVEGGRFAEIAMGAPSADAVVTMQPSDPCGTSEERSVFDGHTRHDWYVSKNDIREWCAGPKDASTVWYFSYVSRTGGYINYYNRSDEPPGYAITLAYNSKDIASFPKKDSPELSQIFDQTSRMLQMLTLKQS